MRASSSERGDIYIHHTETHTHTHTHTHRENRLLLSRVKKGTAVVSCARFSSSPFFFLSTHSRAHFSVVVCCVYILCKTVCLSLAGRHLEFRAPARAKDCRPRGTDPTLIRDARRLSSRSLLPPALCLCVCVSGTRVQ